MRTKKILVLSLVLSSLLSANSFKTDSYIRVGYENHKTKGEKSHTQDAIGGKLSISNVDFKCNGIGGKLSFFSTNKISDSEIDGIPLLSGNGKSYSVLGEAYLFGRYQNSEFSIGRQIIDTPFADSDDVGMIPNSYEAVVFKNNDIKDTTLVLSLIARWSGVDTDEPSKFQDLQNSDAVKMAGILYEGVEGLGVSAYYYDLDDRFLGDADILTYAETIYGGEYNDVEYELGLQIAKQKFKSQKSAKVYGLSVGVNFDAYGFGVSYAYNRVDDHSAINGFGGGPFFTSCKDATIDGVGADIDAHRYGIGIDMSRYGVDGLNIDCSYLDISDNLGKHLNENDITVGYEVDEKLGFTLIHVIEDDEIGDTKYRNTRAFINHLF